MTSPDVELIRWSDRVASPWRNRGGVTREIAAHPAGAPDFDWRISVADVSAHGPFSVYPGIDRVITMLEGAAMDLTVGTDRVRLTPLQPYAFAGEAAVDCTLPDGPTRDFNVMTRRGRVRAEVRVHRLHDTVELPAADGLCLLVCVGAALRVDINGERHVLGRYDTLRVKSPVTVGAGDLLEVVLRPE